MSTTPMIAPDGSVGDVPTANVPVALQAGGKIGINMVAPDGSPGVVPTDQVHQAIRAGGVVQGSPQHLQQMANQALAASGIPGGAAPPAGAFISPINPAQDVQPPAQRALTAYGANLVTRPSFAEFTGQPVFTRDPSGQIRHVDFQPVQPLTNLQGQPISDPQATAIQRIRSGDIAGGVGQLAANVTGLGATMLAGRGVPPEGMTLPPGAAGPYEPYTSPQTQGQRLANVINPPAREITELGRNLAGQTGNVVDFADRTGNPLQTTTDFANAARGAAYETYQYLKNKFVDPIADNEVSVAGANYQGRTVGEGQRARLGDINDRIGDINDQLSSNYIQRRLAQIEEASAADADLKSEHDSLVNILHDEIARSTGVDPAEVAALRQRGGQLGSIADQTQAAVNDRTVGYTKQLYGQNVPKSWAEVAIRGLNRIRGGPESAASRALVGALGDTNIAATPLPTPAGPMHGPASPSWLNYLPEDPRLAIARAQQQAAAEQRARNRQP